MSILIRIPLAILLVIASFIVKTPGFMPDALAILGYVMAGYDVLYRGHPQHPAGARV